MNFSLPTWVISMGESTARKSLLPTVLVTRSGLVSLALVIATLSAGAGLVRWHGDPPPSAESLFDRVWASEMTVDPQGRLAALRVSFAGNSPDEGVWSDVVLIDLDQLHAQRLEVRHRNPTCVALAPGAGFLAFGCHDGSIYSASGPFDVSTGRATGGENLFARFDAEPVFRLAFSPDGRYLAAYGSHFVRVWEWPSGVLWKQWPHEGTTPGFLAFSADSRTILSTDGARDLCLKDVHSGEVLKKVAVKGTEVTSASWSVDRQLLATSPGVAVYRLETGDEVWHETARWTIRPPVAFDPSGTRLATVVHRGESTGIEILGAQDGRLLGRMAGDAFGIAGMVFGSNGLLYTWDVFGNIRAWDVDGRCEEWSFSLLEWASRNP
jgi:WD40 repeat protein